MRMSKRERGTRRQDTSSIDIIMGINAKKNTRNEDVEDTAVELGLEQVEHLNP